MAMNIDDAVKRFLAWPLPDSVRPDGTYPAGDYRKKVGHQLVGTNLLTADEARQMFEHCLSPAPVMEGAQREAVALVGYVHREDAEWLQGGSYREGKLRSYRRHDDDVALYTAPPPPDRVQTRNPAESSIAQPERVERKVVGVVNLTDMATFLRSSAPLQLIPYRAESSDAMRATLCFVADELDKLAGCGIPHAPPTDARGGVTEAMVETACESWLTKSRWRGKTVDDVRKETFRISMRRALEAADRARNPDHDDIGSVYEQAEAWETIVKMLDEIAPGWNHIEGQGTGTNLACHAIRKLLSARKPGYRQVTEKELLASLTACYAQDECLPLETVATHLHDFLNDIGAVIRIQAGQDK